MITFGGTILSMMVALAPGHDGDSSISISDVQREVRHGLVIQIPTGSSDYFNVAHAVAAGIGNSDEVVDGLPVTGISVSVADFGSGRTYPTVGLFTSNLGLDPTGATPDLASPIVSLVSPPNPAPALFTYVFFDTPEGTIASGTTRVHATAQLPPGDSGLLAVGGSSGTVPAGTSFFTSDGYASAARPLAALDLGLNVDQDNSATTSCRPADRKPHGRLRVHGLGCGGLAHGDRLTTREMAGDTLDLAFFGTKPGDKLRLYFSIAPCTPLVPIGPVLSAVADADGDGSYLRLDPTWPAGFSGQTFRFAAAWGNPSCLNPGVGFTNCVTVATFSDYFGFCDDGTVETSWSVQIPSGSSDYFNNDLGSSRPANGIVAIAISVLDFGTAVPAYPKAGVSDANYVVDPSGSTPDLTGPNLLGSIAPFTFPPGSFETTSGLYTWHGLSVPCPDADHTHAWVQFPPGDPGLLGVGGDTTSPNGCSFFSMDGYATPAIGFFVNWGIRLATN